MREGDRLLNRVAGGNRVSEPRDPGESVLHAQISPRRVMGAEGGASSIKLLSYWLGHRKPDL